MLKAYFNANYIEVGVDEAGRGCLAGPVVAAAVILPKNYKNELLDDSKKLNKTQRISLREEIIENAVAWAVAEASNIEIDKINILNASFLAMHRALDKLVERNFEHILVDGNRFSPYNLIPHTCIVKGDGKFMSIAAASILAKTFRDDIMENFHSKYPEYNWQKNAGYPTKFHRQTILRIGFSPLHRLTFKVR